MKHNIVAAAVAVAALAFPLASFAATYGYINSSGSVAFVNADNDAQALLYAPSIDPHSGVFIASPQMVALMTTSPTVTGTVIVTSAAPTVSTDTTITPSAAMTAYYYDQNGDIVYGAGTSTAYMTTTYPGTASTTTVTNTSTGNGSYTMSPTGYYSPNSQYPSSPAF